MKQKLSIALALLVPFTTALRGADWPEWGGRPSRNMASTAEKGLPNQFDCGKENTAGEIDMSTVKNVKWMVRVGPNTCGSPVVAGGKVFIGTRMSSTNSFVADPSNPACLLCVDEKTGIELGRFPCRRPEKENGVERCNENWGVCSTPTVDENLIYFVGPYQEVYCLDLKAWLAQGQTGTANKQEPSTAENSTAPITAPYSETCILWKYDLAKEVNSVQHHTASCSPLVFGNFVYVCTGNTRWQSSPHRYSPLAPSLVAFNKKTGQLVARDDEQIGERLWRGQWTSPSMGVVNGKAQIYFGAGDGTCYAFEPVDPKAVVPANRWTTTTLRGPVVQFIDVDSTGTSGAAMVQPTPTSSGSMEIRTSIRLPVCTPVHSIPTAKVPDVLTLKKIWSFDCIPPEYRKNPFYSRDAKGDGKGRPCEITGTPVFYRNRVYIAIGADPQHGGRDSKGNLVCIDATRTGDITKTGCIWNYDKLNQSISTVAIADGLVFAQDEADVVHCLNADTGQCYWTYAAGRNKSETGYNSPLVADGKLYAANSILMASKELKPLGSIKSSTFSTPCVANGVLFMVNGVWLTAVYDKGDKP